MPAVNDAGLKALREARSNLEHVAHLQGWERQLLPIVDMLEIHIKSYDKMLKGER